MRIDKWLWAVRVFKTRSTATLACRGHLVKIEGEAVKPSREIKIGDVIELEAEGPFRKLRAVAVPPNRVGAKLTGTYREDLTPPQPKSGRLDFLDHPPLRRPRGTGRPTKRERRQIDDLVAGEDDLPGANSPRDP